MPVATVRKDLWDRPWATVDRINAACERLARFEEWRAQRAFEEFEKGWIR